MHKVLITFITVIAMARPGAAQVFERRASVDGNPNEGKCTVQVVVDGAADVEIRGGNATLRTVAGSPSGWQRFDCTGIMPNSPAHFRFQAIEGRGRAELVRSPGEGEPAVVRIEDPQPGASVYSFNIFWSPTGMGAERTEFTRAEAMQLCRDSVQDHVARQGYHDLDFRSTNTEQRPGRNEWIYGSLHGFRGGVGNSFDFSCRVDLNSGDLLSLDVTPR